MEISSVTGAVAVLADIFAMFIFLNNVIESKI